MEFKKSQLKLNWVGGLYWPPLTVHLWLFILSWLGYTKKIKGRKKRIIWGMRITRGKEIDLLSFSLFFFFGFGMKMMMMMMTTFKALFSSTDMKWTQKHALPVWPDSFVVMFWVENLSSHLINWSCLMLTVFSSKTCVLYVWRFELHTKRRDIPIPTYYAKAWKKRKWETTSHDLTMKMNVVLLWLQFELHNNNHFKL